MREQAAVEGSLVRFRTVLMTALLAMLGLLPMALSHGHRLGSAEAAGRRHHRRPGIGDLADAGRASGALHADRAEVYTPSRYARAGKPVRRLRALAYH